LPNNWEVGLRFRYLGRAPYVPVDEEATTESYPIIISDYDRLGEERLNAYNATDVRIDKKWNFEKWTLDVFLEVTNVLGSDLPSDPTYTLERDAEGSIIIPRNLILVPDTNNSAILPTLGVVVDF